MKKYSANDYYDIYKAIICMYLTNLTDIFNRLFNINLPLLRYFFAMAGVFFLLKGIYSTSRNLKIISNFDKYLFYSLVLVTVVMIARGFPLILEGNNNFINLKLFISGQFLLYLLPFIIFSEPNLSLIKKIMKLSFSLLVFYLLVTLIFISYFTRDIFHGAEYFGVLFVAGASLLLLTQAYHSSRIRFITIITFLLVLLLNMLFARRNQVLYFISIFFFFLIINITNKSFMAKKRRGIIIMGSIIIVLLLSGYLYIAKSSFSYFFEKSQTGMGSREYVIGKFFEDFDSHPNDYIYGRGINGLVLAGLNAGSDPTGQRSAIENGYLQHILVGGGIYLFLILLISFRAIYLGFFKSKNIFTKAFAAIILTYIIDMAGFAIPNLTLKHFMIWLGIGVCYSARIRNYSDIYIKSIVGLK